MPAGVGYMKKLGGILVITLLLSVGIVTALDDNATGTQGTGDISEDIAPYDGPIDADSPLYGLKLAMEDLDETFTFNDTQRVEKRLDHAQIRIAEVRRELDLNRTTSADRTLESHLAETQPDRRIINPLWIQCYRAFACTENDHPAPDGPGQSAAPVPE